MQDDRDGSLWWVLVILAFLGVGVPGALRVGATAPAAPAAPAASAEPAGEARAETKPTPPATPRDLPASFFRPLQAMLACEPARPPLANTAPDLDGWIQSCRLADLARVRDAIVAIVPDPLDSMYEHTFDRLLESIGRAAAQADYVRDRYYLPWQVDLAARRRSTGAAPPPADEHESTPGLLLFRTDCRPAVPAAAPCAPAILAVLLVGETSAWGVNHEALQRALVLADRFETAAKDRPLRVLGPTFSGSVSSLREELKHYSCEHLMQHRGFTVVTGAATRAANQEVMRAPWAPGLWCRLMNRFPRDPPVRYEATVTDDDDTQQRFYAWLAEQMGLAIRSSCALRGVALLTESDTPYGRGFQSSAGAGGASTPRARSEPHDRCAGQLKPERVVRYPSRIARMRNIYERTRKPDPSGAQVLTEESRRLLELSLVDTQESVEALPAFSDKTQLADELVLVNSLKAMCRSDLRFLGIIGTDLIDRLFLAREAHRYCPNLRLFTLESDVLFGHPDVAEALNGSLIVTPFPLFAQHGPWTPPRRRREIAPFGDSASQGTYNAMLRLLELQARERIDTMWQPAEDPPSASPLPVWVSAVGNGALWPIAELSPIQEAAPATAAPGAGDRASARASTGPRRTLSSFTRSSPWRWAFGAVWLTCTLLAAGYWVGRYASNRRIPGLTAFRVFQPVQGAAGQHALLSLLILVPATCAYVAAASLVLIERILQQHQPHELFSGSLLNGLLAGCDPPWPGLPIVLTWIGLTAACADAVLAPWIARGAPELRDRAARAWWSHFGPLGTAALVAVALLALRRGLVFDRATWLTLRERAIAASSGLSPLLPAGAFAAAVGIAAWAQLVRLHHAATSRIADPMARCEDPLTEGMRAQHGRALAALHQLGGARWLGVVVVVGSALVWWFGRIPRAMTMLEPPLWSGALALAVLAALALTLASYVAFVQGAYRLRGYLRRHANLPCVEAFSRLPGRAAQKLSAILVKPPEPAELTRSLQQLRLLASQLRATRLELDEGLRAALDQALGAASLSRIEDALRRQLLPAAPSAGAGEPPPTAQELLHDVAVTLAQVIASQWARPASPEELARTSAALTKLGPERARELPAAECYQRAADDETRLWLRLAEELVAAQSTTFFHEVLYGLRRLLTAATAAALLLLAGVSSYPFERQPMLLVMAQGLIVVMVIGTLASLSSLEKSEVLGRIRKGETGKVTWNRTFIARVGIYGLLPILSVVATQLPAVGGTLFGWLPGLLGLLQ